MTTFVNFFVCFQSQGIIGCRAGSGGLLLLGAGSGGLLLGSGGLLRLGGFRFPGKGANQPASSPWRRCAMAAGVLGLRGIWE